MNNASTDRKVEIISKAAELYDTRGFHATSMEDIAAAVGLRKPSLYHYFNSKDDILFLIHDEFIELLIRGHLRRVELGVARKILLLEAMADIMELMDTHRGHVRVFFEALRELPEESRKEIIEKRSRYQQMIADIFEEMIAANEIRPVRASLAAQGLFGMCTWAYQWYRAGGPLSARDIAYFFWDMLMNGLATTPEMVATLG